MKLFGTMVTVSACLFSGPEGPMILIGSSVASAFTRGLKVVTCSRVKFVIGTNLMSRSSHQLLHHSGATLTPFAGSTVTVTGATSSLRGQQVCLCWHALVTRHS